MSLLHSKSAVICSFLLLVIFNIQLFSQIEFNPLISDISKKEIIQSKTDDFLLEFINKRFGLAERLPDLMKNLNEFKKIQDRLDPEGILFLTHGTIFKSKGNEYYYSADGYPSVDSYCKSLADLIKAKEYYYLLWNGQNSDQARLDAVNDFTRQIIEQLNIISQKTGRNVRNIPVNLAGHSHGANIMALTANQLQHQGYKVQLLFTINSPNRVGYQLDNDMAFHINLYSFNDWFGQIFSSWDFDDNIIDNDYLGPARVTYNKAINICIDYFLNPDTYKFYKENKPYTAINPTFYHNGSRSEQLLLDLGKQMSENTGKVDADNLDRQKRFILSKQSGYNRILQNFTGTFFLTHNIKGIGPKMIKTVYQNINGQDLMIIINLETENVIAVFRHINQTGLINFKNLTLIPGVSSGYIYDRSSLTDKKLTNHLSSWVSVFGCSSNLDVYTECVINNNGNLTLKIIQNGQAELNYGEASYENILCEYEKEADPHDQIANRKVASSVSHNMIINSFF